MTSSMDADKENHPKAQLSTAYQQPRIEKYRLQNKLEDVVGNEETLVRLQAIAIDGNLPNLILCMVIQEPERWERWKTVRI